MLTVWGFIIATGLSVGLLFNPLLRKERARTYYRRHRDAFPEYCVALSDAGVHVENEAGTNDLPWERVAWVAETPKGLLFYGPGHRLLFWLPARVLTEDAAREQVRLLLETKGVQVRH